MIGSFGAFNILQGSLVNNYSIYGKLNIFNSKTACFSPKMAISEKILILFRSPLNEEMVYMSVFMIK
jgi:hypothetical protein